MTLQRKAMAELASNTVSMDTLKNLSPDTLKNISPYTLNNLSPDTLNNLSPYTLNNISPDTLNNLSPYTLKNLSPYTLNNLSPDTLNNLSPYTLKNLSPYTLNNISPYTLKNVTGKIKEWESIPVLIKPYSKLLEDINSKNRVHKQSTYGPEECPKEVNMCGTEMCTAGHLVNMSGDLGYKLKDKYGWAVTATMIHYKAHPDYPCQNFGSIPQEWALAYIEEMAERESKEEEV